MSARSKAQPEQVLSERQESVLRAVVKAYIAGGSPVGSRTLSHLLPMNLSAASIRNTMAELTDLELIEKTHASAGRTPTERGLRLFVNCLIRPREIEAWDRRSLEHSFDEIEATSAARVASQLLSDHSGQLGFVMLPRLESVRLCHLSLVRLSTEKLLAVLISRDGQAHRRVIDDPGRENQSELDQISSALTERLVGRTLAELREVLSSEVAVLRDRADRMVRRALTLGLRALEAPLDSPEDLVIASHLALLDQPEFHDPERIRELFAAVETRVRLLEVLDKVLGERVAVAFGDELDEAGLRHCALVVAPYGAETPPLGALGVIGPNRMDYPRIIPLVSFCSRLITEKLTA